MSRDVTICLQTFSVYIYSFQLNFWKIILTSVPWTPKNITRHSTILANKLLVLMDWSYFRVFTTISFVSFWLYLGMHRWIIVLIDTWSHVENVELIIRTFFYVTVISNIDVVTFLLTIVFNWTRRNLDKMTYVDILGLRCFDWLPYFNWTKGLRRKHIFKERKAIIQFLVDNPEVVPVFPSWNHPGWL